MVVSAGHEGGMTVRLIPAGKKQKLEGKKSDSERRVCFISYQFPTVSQSLPLFLPEDK